MTWLLLLAYLAVPTALVVGWIACWYFDGQDAVRARKEKEP